MITILRNCKARPKLNVIYACKSTVDQSDKSNDDTKVKRELPKVPTMTCCMSGCTDCVWIEYADKLSEYYQDVGERAIEEVNNNITDPNLKAFILFQLRMKKDE